MTGKTTTIEYDVAAPMRDGTVLRADVYRPSGQGPFPVLLARTPYDKGDSSELVFIDPWVAAKRGFIVVVQDVRGRGASEGEWVPFAHEAQDGADTIAWAAGLPGSNGRVAMWGLSYLGNVQWLAATQHPPALRAIAPSFTFRDPDNGLHERGGALEHGLSVSWSLMTALDLITRRTVGDDDALRAQLGALVTDLDNLDRVLLELPSGRPPVFDRLELAPLADLTHTSPAAVTAAGEGDGSVVPSLNVGGWFDVFLQGVLDNHTANARNARLLIGPWSHVSTLSRQGDVDFGFAANGFALDLAGTLTDLTLDWLGRRLRDDQPQDSDAPVRIFVMGTNQWREESAWPPQRAVDTEFFLTEGGGLSVERPTAAATTTYRYDPDNPVPTHGGSIYLPDRPAGMVDQAAIEARDDVLVFTSEPLRADLEITGRIGATLTVATDGPTTDWVVRLCDVDQAGRSRNITDGIARIAGPADTPQTVPVDLWSTSIVLRAGHRIRVQVTSSNFPRWDRNLNSAVPAQTATMPRVALQTVHLGGGVGASSVTLPVIP